MALESLIRVALLRAALLRLALGLVALLLALPGGPLRAQSVHAYRDANGQWVFTDRGTGPAGAQGDAFTLPRSPEALHVALERSDAEGTTRLTAVNDCLCVVTMRIAITQSELAGVPRGTNYPATLEPGTRQLIFAVPHGGSARPELQYVWSVALGSPEASHNP